MNVTPKGVGPGAAYLREPGQPAPRLGAARLQTPLYTQPLRSNHIFTPWVSSM